MSRTISQYFNQFGSKNEQRLVEDLIIESIQINGMKVYYIPKHLVAFDALFGEDPQMEFLKYYPIEMYFDNPNGFEGDKDILSKFGLELRDKANFICSRRRFNQAVRYDGSNALPNTTYTETEVRPMEGDLIYMPLTNDCFQIQFADHESVFRQLGGLYIWRISVQKFDYSHEKIQTGLPEVDRVQDLFGGEVSFDPNAFDPAFDADELANDPIADNALLKHEGTTLLDFTEENPFGEPDRE